MATVVNNPGVSSESSSSAVMVGAILLVLAILAIIFLSRGGFGSFNTGGSNTAPGVSVPERVDVNVNTPNQ